MRGKKKDGRPLPETPDMKIWREEFDEMGLEEHHNKLKALGLSDEDIKEFDEDFKGNGAKKKSKQDNEDS
jgi:hypothetical protein